MKMQEVVFILIGTMFLLAGKTSAQDSGGDVSIVAMGITRDQQTLNTFYEGFGGGWGWRGFGDDGFGEATTTAETYKVGTAVVDLFETKAKRLIWRGSSSDTLSDKSDKNIKNLDKGVDKMFALPSRRGGVLGHIAGRL
jgi:hypothetical protein